MAEQQSNLPNLMSSLNSVSDVGITRDDLKKRKKYIDARHPAIVT